MKKYFIPLIVLVFLTVISCSEKTNIEEEKEAILNVLQEETDAFIANDMKRMSSIHILEGTTARISLIGREDCEIDQGWDKISERFENNFSRKSGDSPWKNPRNTKDKIIMRVSGNSAWIVCDNTWKYEYENDEKQFTNMQIAFFEKVNGEWKFSFDAYAYKPVAKSSE